MSKYRNEEYSGIFLFTHFFLKSSSNITRLNREIETEYLRLAHAQKRPVVQNQESRLAKWLGIKYLTGSDTGRLHSSTAFVEFKTMAAKQHAVQCNVTGMNDCMVVTPVPEVRDLIWDNMHVSRALINTRKSWANFVLTGCLGTYILTVLCAFKAIPYTDSHS
jgi:hypothetical protein